MTRKDFEALNIKSAELDKLLANPEIVRLQNEINDIKRRCDHKMPDGLTIRDVSWQHYFDQDHCDLCAQYLLS